MPPQPEEAADDLKRRIGEAIRTVRGEMRQGPLADLLGVDQSTFSGWESGRYMAPLNVLPLIEEACGVRAGTILRLAGLVDDSTEAVILSDADLDDRSRHAVATYYRFVRDEMSGKWD